jgi:hypothetical protein
MERGRVHRVVFGVGESISGHVYGTIIVMGAIVAGAGTAHGLVNLAVIVVTTVVVLWLAHVYAAALEHSLEERHRLERHELVAVAREELPIVLSAVAPTAALLIGAFEVVRDSRAVWLALVVGLVSLAVQGVRYARIEAIGLLAMLGVVATNLALGLSIVVLKVAVSH